jgi:hypothetical protein
MASREPCLTRDRIDDIVFEAELEALASVQSPPRGKPGQLNIVNNVPIFHPNGELETFLFEKVKEVTERSFKMGKGTYGINLTRNMKGGSRHRRRSNKRKTRRS